MLAYKLLGFFFIGLAFCGVFLPLLPTVPFLLLAAGCFAKSSHACHQWLINQPTFGPLIKDWEQNRCMRKKAKITAYASITFFGGISTIILIQNAIVKTLGVLLVISALYFIKKIKCCEKDK